MDLAKRLELGPMELYVKVRGVFRRSVFRIGDVLIVGRSRCFFRRPNDTLGIGAEPLWFGYPGQDPIRVLEFDERKVAEKMWVSDERGRPVLVDATIERLTIELDQRYMLDLRRGLFDWKEEGDSFRRTFLRRRRFVAH